LVDFTVDNLNTTYL